MELQLSYNVPITESSTQDGEFIIQGTAINATTTDNGHKFLVEELRPSAASLTGVPLLVDHNNLVENIKGRVLSGTFNEVEEKVDFRAKVVDEKTIKLIKEGLLNTVSVGANVKEIEESEDGSVIARGIKFKELSLVAVPADEGATFTIAMSEAYNKMKESKDEDKEDLQDLKGGLSEMSEENNDKVIETIEKMSKAFDEKLDALAAQVKEMKEADIDEEESKEETKEESEEESTEEKEEEKSESEESEDESEEDEESTKESSKYNIVEGNGSLKGGSFSYEW